MKFTFAWLKEHLETDADLDAILEKLTIIGLEVEKVTDRAKSLESFCCWPCAGSQPASRCGSPAHLPGRHWRRR